jgi:hypothetical protein
VKSAYLQSALDLSSLKSEPHPEHARVKNVKAERTLAECIFDQLECALRNSETPQTEVYAAKVPIGVRSSELEVECVHLRLACTRDFVRAFVIRAHCKAIGRHVSEGRASARVFGVLEAMDDLVELRRLPITLMEPFTNKINCPESD